MARARRKPWLDEQAPQHHMLTAILAHVLCVFVCLQSVDGSTIQEGSEMRVRIVGTKMDHSDIVGGWLGWVVGWLVMCWLARRPVGRAPGYTAHLSSMGLLSCPACSLAYPAFPWFQEGSSSALPHASVPCSTCTCAHSLGTPIVCASHPPCPCCAVLHRDHQGGLPGCAVSSHVATFVTFMEGIKGLGLLDTASLRRFRWARAVAA